VRAVEVGAGGREVTTAAGRPKAKFPLAGDRDMESRTVNEEGSPGVLLVMGFGNRLDGTDERWFIDRLAAAGYRVHAVALPTNGTDFEADYRDPVQRYHDDHDPAALVGHSLGGLVAAHLDTDAVTVYLAPWWGLYGEKFLTWERWVIPRLPTAARLIPIRTEREEIGSLLPEADFSLLPKRVSPAFVTAVYRAQQRRPPVDEATVFVSLQDTIVSLAAIGRAVDRDQVRLYDGGHQLFSSAGRERATERVLAALPD
jgi:pimeloyl-ACP methyl ester carboxylesterase